MPQFVGDARYTVFILHIRMLQFAVEQLQQPDHTTIIYQRRHIPVTGKRTRAQW